MPTLIEIDIRTSGIKYYAIHQSLIHTTLIVWIYFTQFTCQWSTGQWSDVWFIVQINISIFAGDKHCLHLIRFVLRIMLMWGIFAELGSPSLAIGDTPSLTRHWRFTGLTVPTSMWSFVPRNGRPKSVENAANESGATASLVYICR